MVKPLTSIFSCKHASAIDYDTLNTDNDMTHKRLGITVNVLLITVEKKKKRFIYHIYSYVTVLTCSSGSLFQNLRALTKCSVFTTPFSALIVFVNWL